MTTVAIFGTGPAGLAAACGVRAADPNARLMFFTNRLDPSRLNGCQYLHAPIPGMGNPHAQRVRYSLTGTREEYSFKVYGPNYTGQVSADDFEGEHLAWDLRTAYADMWDHFIDQGSPYTMWHRATVDVGWLSAFDFAAYEYVISTVPAKALCLRGCTFASEEVWAVGDAPPLQRLPWQMPDNTIICHGEPNPSWYRSAKVFGHQTREWPGWSAKPFVDDMEIARVEKPLWTNCLCWQGEANHVHRMGRYGQWQKKYLVHHAFLQAAQLVTHGAGPGMGAVNHDAIGPDGLPL
jgi:hypothetical protein